MSFKDEFFGIIKQAGKVFSCVFGLDGFGKSKEGQDLQDGVNDIAYMAGRKKPVFHTEKEKKKEERRAAEAEARVQEQIAENTRRIAEALDRLSRRP